MKADRLGLMYKNGVLEFLEFVENSCPDNNDIFIVLVLFMGTSKNGQRKKY